MLFILVTCRSQFYLYFFFSFSSTGSTFNSSKLSSLLSLSESTYPSLLLKNLTSTDINRFLSFCLRVQISHPYIKTGSASALYTLMLADFWTKLGLKALFKISSIWKNFVSFCWIYFGSMLTNCARCRTEIRPITAMPKAAFSKKKTLFTSTLDLHM